MGFAAHRNFTMRPEFVATELSKIEVAGQLLGFMPCFMDMVRAVGAVRRGGARQVVELGAQKCAGARLLDFACLGLAAGFRLSAFGYWLSPFGFRLGSGLTRVAEEFHLGRDCGAGDGLLGFVRCRAGLYGVWLLGEWSLSRPRSYPAGHRLALRLAASD